MSGFYKTIEAKIKLVLEHHLDPIDCGIHLEKTVIKVNDKRVRAIQVALTPKKINQEKDLFTTCVVLPDDFKRETAYKESMEVVESKVVEIAKEIINFFYDSILRTKYITKKSPAETINKVFNTTYRNLMIPDGLVNQRIRIGDEGE